MPRPTFTTFEPSSLATNPQLGGYDPALAEGRFDMKPAKWIWFPSTRTLANTLVYFAKSFDLKEVPKEARGWICADSRYTLYINGRRVQFGPAPFDPRFPEADPVDLAPFLQPGSNTIGIHALFYGHGDGTWPTGKPGVIFRAQIGKEIIATDHTWLTKIDRAVRPGGYKRWFLRAFQEIDDARLWPRGFSHPGYKHDESWLNAIELDAQADQASITSSYNNYLEDLDLEDRWRSELRPRSIPMMTENFVQAHSCFVGELVITGDTDNYWEFGTPHQFTVRRQSSVTNRLGSRVVRYALPEAMVGWPLIEVRTSEAVQITVVVQESVPDIDKISNPKFHGWFRHITAEGNYSFAPYDYETGKYIELHFEVPKGGWCELVNVRFLRRRLISDFTPSAATGDERIDKVLLASHATLVNSCQDIVVDGMGRERQQYAGDGSHQLHAARQAHGQFEISRRFLTQFAQGQNLNGVFFDSWPGYDRYARLGQRQIGATKWGSIVDHSIGFVCDHVHHWQQTCDRQPYEKNKSKIRKFLGFLDSIRDDHGLLRVHGLGAETVWMDHEAYRSQDQKQLALNLYEQYMHALLAMIDGLEPRIDPKFEGALGKYFRKGRLTNSPQTAGDAVEIDDRALAHFIWLNANADWNYEGSTHHGLEAAIEDLVNKNCTHSYPANSVWRHWAYAQVGRIDLILNELRTRWRAMNSIDECGTLSEFWTSTPNSNSLCSHCAVSPTIMMQQAILGLGFLRNGRMRLRPQLGDLSAFAAKAFTPKGLIEFGAERVGGEIRCHITKPLGLEMCLCLAEHTDHAQLDLDFDATPAETGECRYDLTELTVIEDLRLTAYPPNQLISEF